MPRIIAVLTLVLACPSFAQDAQDTQDKPLGPLDYIAIIEKSKLHYNFVSKPSKTPVEVLTCPRRDERSRLVVDGTKRDLVAWEVAPAALKLLLEGEKHYHAERMKEAAEKYRVALEIDPQAIAGYFFLGDALLFGSNDAVGALELYRKGLALDPTMPSGHFYSATALTRLGRMKEAREEVVQALTFYPGYEAIWKIGTETPGHWGIRPMVRRRFEPPVGYIGKKGKNGVDVFMGNDAEWLGYAMCKAVWANEKEFEDRRSTDSSWSLAEEHACLTSHLMSTYRATEVRLEKEQQARGVAEPSIAEDAILAALPPRERHLVDVVNANLVEGYIYFEIVGQQCPAVISLLDDNARREVEKYIRAYVVIARDNAP